jgi:arylsulfatase A-like enzyme
MKDNITRRDFMKMAGLYSLGLPAIREARLQDLSTPGKILNNILIVVFDAFTAYNMSLYGYPRDTTPNINRLAKRAIVYHNHFAGGSFTTPGTASLFTGSLPWTHRAFIFNDTVDKSYKERTIFHVFSDYHRIAYSQNSLAETHLKLFRRDIDDHIPQDKLCLKRDQFINFLFANDPDAATLAWARIMKKNEDGASYSLFLSKLYQKYEDSKIKDIQNDFPLGLPVINVDNYYRLEDVINWLSDQLPLATPPFLGYFHFLPPHRPYNTRRDFFRRFARDNYAFPAKPISIFDMGIDDYQLQRLRNHYDEYILYVDEEFSRLVSSLEKSGILDDTWLILTSDHGELFERGLTGHITETMYQPVIRIPLLIFEPRKKSGGNIYTSTSAIDVLPTLAHVSGINIPEWCEGSILPPYNTTEAKADRSLYVIDAKKNAKYAPFRRASVTMIKGQYKLIYYFGYEQLKEIGDFIEIYDIHNDPEEMENLYSSRKELGDELLAEVKVKLAEVNAPYE